MKILNKYFIYAAALVIAATAASCNNSGKKSDGKTEPAAETAKSPATDSAALAFDPEILGEEPVFVIKTDMGDIKIKLYKQTPLHRDNFVKLASERFYDGILFHRVIEGFMIQTGDPLTKNPEASAKYGTGGPGYNVAAEILPDFHHKKGAVAAARKGDTVNPQRESSGSQFYIVEDESTCRQLDGQYTIFGETIEGFDVIDKIAAVETDGRDRPVTPVRIISVLPEISVAAQPAQEAQATQQE